MANRGSGHKRQSRVESSVTADAVRSEVDAANFTPGFPSTGSFPVNDNSHLETRPEGARSGVRSNPGDKGFLYSDTPTTTVFIGKKQWLTPGWTYVVDSDSAELNGRKYETLKRDILERIITRKLRWLSNHEAFTKVRNKLNNATQFGRLSTEIQTRLLSRIDSEDPTALQPEDLDLLLDLEAVPSGFGNNSTTRYYTTPITGLGKDTAVAEYNRKLQQLRSLEQFAGPDDAENLQQLIDNQEGLINRFEQTIAVLTERINQLSEIKANIETDLSNGRIFGVDSEGRQDREIVLEEELTRVNRELDFLLTDRASKEEALEESQLLLAEYNRRDSEDIDIDKLREEVAELREQAQEQLANSSRLVGLNSFNGIIEFNNVTSVSTSVEIQGQGSATLSMENPNNILRISRDDILLAMSDDYNLEISLNGNPDTPTAEFLRTQWSISTNPDASLLSNVARGAAQGAAVGSAFGPFGTVAGAVAGGVVGATTTEQQDRTIGNLKFFEGRYVDPVGQDIITSNTTSVDAKSGFTNNEIAFQKAQYARQQGAIYNEINSRVRSAPPGFDTAIVEGIQLPTTYTELTSEWLKKRHTLLAFVFFGESTDEIESTPEYQIIQSYIQTLEGLEQRLVGQLTFNAEAVENDSNDPNASETANNRRFTRGGDVFSGVRSALGKAFDENEPSTSMLQRLFRELETHFTNKSVVEVADRVWVWMSSPSRTTQLDDTGNGLIESAVGRAAAELALAESARADLRNLRQRLTEIEERRVATNNELQSLQQEEAVLQARPLEETQDGDYQRIAEIAARIEELDQEQQELRREQEEILDEIERIENEIDGAVPGNRGDESRRRGFSSVTVGTATEALPPSALQLSTFGGLEEREFQVFEGVVSSITGSFNGQEFSLNVQCRDLTYYLELTRVPETPALNSRDTIAVLNDPIYRSITGSDREIDCGVRQGSYIDAIRELQQDGSDTEAKDAQGHPLAGRWKSGVYVTTAFPYVQSTNANAITKAEVGATEEELSCVHGLSVYSKLYAGLDAANLISILTTGIPFNFSLYSINLQNGPRGDARGALTTEDETGQIRPAPSNPFEVARALVGVQNTFTGNFQPFLELSRSYTRERVRALREAVVSARQRMVNIFQRRVSDPESQAGFTQVFFSTVQLLAEGKVADTLPGEPDYQDQAVRATATADELERQRAEANLAREEDTDFITAKELDVDSDFYTDAAASGSEFINSLISQQGFIPTIPGREENAEDAERTNGSANRLRIFSAAQERRWREHFSRTFPDPGTIRTIRNNQLTQERDVLQEEQELLQQRISDIRSSINDEQESAQLRAERRQEIARLQERQAEVERRIAEIDEALEAPTNETPPRINLDISVTLSSDEVGVFVELARARDNYNDFRELYNQFILNTVEALGIEGDTEDESVENIGQLELSLSRKANRSAIISTKRKIIERRKPNFLLISDSYVSDRTLQPYQLEISNANTSEVWRASYTSTFGICREAADTVDYEFYCDENGHLRFKPPTYNRVLQEHFSLNVLRPEVRLQLKNLFPGLEATQVAGELKVLQNIVATQFEDAQVQALTQAPIVGVEISADDTFESLLGDARFTGTVAGVENAAGEDITGEATNTNVSAGQTVSLVELARERAGEQGEAGQVTDAGALGNALEAVDKAERELDRSFELIGLNSTSDDIQRAQIKLEVYLRAYYLFLNEINRQIERVVANFFSIEGSEITADEFRRDYRAYLARVNLCVSARLARESDTESPIRDLRCQFNEDGLPIEDDEGPILPEGLTVEDLNDPNARPEFLAEVGPDVLEVIQRAPAGFELPSGFTLDQMGLNERSRDEIAENYTTAVKTALPQYLRAIAERRVALQRHGNEVADQTFVAQNESIIPTSWLYVNSPRVNSDPKTYAAGRRRSSTVLQNQPETVPDAVIPGNETEEALREQAAQNAVKRVALESGTDDPEAANEAALQAAGQAAEDFTAPPFVLKTTVGGETVTDPQVLANLPPGQGRDVLVTPPGNDNASRAYGINRPTRSEIDAALRLSDLNGNGNVTLNGRDSVDAVGGDDRTLLSLMEGSVLVPSHLWFYLDAWRTHFNIEAAVNFFSGSSLTQEQIAANREDDPEYIRLASLRFEATRLHALKMQELLEDNFKSVPVDELELGDNLTLEQQALVDTQDSEGQVDLVTAFDLRALEEVLEQPYFLDELHIHRIAPQIILQESYTEKQPDFVRLDVTGKQDYTQIDRVTGAFYNWAGGVDYDLWRTYGWSQSSIERPFLHDRETTRLYCQAMLARQKSRVFSAQVTVRGDSKYRVGDCVFIEDANMYYYIIRVSHSFSFGDYTTQLQLEYGRRPDDFIPHPFDTLGAATFNASQSEINERYPLGLNINGSGISVTPIQQRAQAEEQRLDLLRREQSDKRKASEEGTGGL